MQGYAIAQINLGYLFENGIGVEQNYSTALAYYRMAAEPGIMRVPRKQSCVC